MILFVIVVSSSVRVVLLFIFSRVPLLCFVYIVVFVVSVFLSVLCFSSV